jgi:hypothetical protein
MADDSNPRQFGIRPPEVIIRETLARIKDEAKRLENRGRNYHWKHAVFTFVTIVFGVAAPALVTYAQGIKSQGTISHGPDGWANAWALVAILATALVAAASSLKTAFRWGDRFGVAELAALELDELASSTEFNFERVMRVTRNEEIYS